MSDDSPCPDCGSGPAVWERIKRASKHEKRTWIAAHEVQILERWFERQRCHRDAYLNALVKIATHQGATVTIKLPDPPAPPPSPRAE